MARHVFPNITAPLIVQASISFGFATSPRLVFPFGVGQQGPGPVVGDDGRRVVWVLAIRAMGGADTGVAIALTVLGFQLVGDGLRDALDPRLRN